MCGRYLITFSEKMEKEMFEIIREVQDRVNARYSKDPKAVLHTNMIFPSNLVPIITNEAVEPMFWGLIGWRTKSKTKKKPDGTPDWNKPKLLINTRFDTATATGKPSNMWDKMLRDSFHNRRCIIPTSGFYEWQTIIKNDKKEQHEYLFNLAEPITYVAGIYNTYENDFGEEWRHFSMMTTEPNETIIDVHDRMPVVLLPGEHDEWLNGDYQKFMDRSKVKLHKKFIRTA